MNRRRVGSGDAGSKNPGRRPGFRLISTSYITKTSIAQDLMFSCGELFSETSLFNDHLITLLRLYTNHLVKVNDILQTAAAPQLVIFNGSQYVLLTSIVNALFNSHQDSDNS